MGSLQIRLKTDYPGLLTWGLEFNDKCLSKTHEEDAWECRKLGEAMNGVLLGFHLVMLVSDF